MIRIAICMLAGLFFLTGCATRFERQAYNNEAATHIKKLTVSKWSEPEDIKAIVINHPGNSFGLIGMAIASSNTASKSEQLTKALDMSKTKISTDFGNKLAKGLSDLGYEVLPVDVKRGTDAKEHAEMLRKDKGQNGNLMVTLDFSYLAAGAKTDYFPSVGALVVLEDAQTKAILFRESYNYGYNDGNPDFLHFDAAPECKFGTIEVLVENPDRSRKCLSDGVDVIIPKILTDLTKQ